MIPVFQISEYFQLKALTQKVRDSLVRLADLFKPLNLNAFCWSMAPQSVRYITLLLVADQKPELGIGRGDSRRPWSDFSVDQQTTLNAFMRDIFNDFSIWASIYAQAQGYFDSYKGGVDARRDKELREALEVEKTMEREKVRAAA